MSIIEKAIEKLNKHSDQEAHLQNVNVRKDAPARSSNYTSKFSDKDLAKKAAAFKVETISASSLIAPDHNVPFLADEFRRIKRPLLANAFGKQSKLVKDGNVIMITSSLPGEGKSFTAANLAISMAMEKDFTVLLVDADVGVSKITRMFDLENSLGLTDLITNGNIDIGRAIVKTDFPCLSIIPAGHKNLHAAELLGSQGMADIVEELATRYNNRIILFDSPPLLATAEPAVLSEKMGQIVLVVEANKTPQSAVHESVGMLNRDKPIGLILNKTRRSLNYSKYGYGYGYGEQKTNEAK